ncbi:DUF4962 domain-containing protein [Tamlana fucoidanivorans]|uniref:DUF4962 domain-containing protein n=1 Tax=Allotamlana fucoidanivorans TaxID=2583814 RepID=A0A5C4SP30_9FLAO|nr:DUF4962 domain-containing protein [Tamlana fucoidanivorans]TNJ46032.1 DUF4962 domain-containing protein [Tamlana fucoidanivorans]
MNPKHRLLLNLFVILVFCRLSNAQRKTEEKKDFPQSMEMVRQTPFPSSGSIKSNPPYFIWSPKIEKRLGVDTFQFEINLHQVRLSQSIDFDTPDVMWSEELEWTFWHPNKILEKGKWYWQYATIEKGTKLKKWSKPIEFDVDGNEDQFLTPSAKEFVESIPKEHPRVLTSPELIGNIGFSKKELDKFLSYNRRFLNSKLPESLIYNDEKVIEVKKKNLDKKKLTRFIARNTKEIYRDQFYINISLIKAYLVSGEKMYSNEALRRYRYLKNQYETILKQGYYNDFTEGMYLSISTLIFDTFYTELDYNEKRYIEELLVEHQRKTYKGLLHRAGLHLHKSSHLWQHHLRDFFITSLALTHHVPEASKWLSYAYELWSMRAPIGSTDDGGWAMGNSYIGANTRSLIEMPALLSRYSGVNFFNKQWYNNISKYLMYTSPIGHIAGGFGDNADIKRETMVPLVRAIKIIKPNDTYAHHYIESAGEFGNNRSKRELTLLNDNNNLYWNAIQTKNLFRNTEDLTYTSMKSLQLAEDFRDVGIVAMHTNLDNPNKNLMVSFKSSPYGLIGHAHAAQNSFNIQIGGEPLFFRTGYYSSSSDFHSLQSYRHTRAHNTILADGMGQKFHSDGYGYIPRFLTGDKISYCVGDASNAYNGELIRDAFKPYFKDWNVEMTNENGFGDPGITKFRRHLVFLRPNIIIIYDDLEANKPVDWNWLIHSKDNLKYDKNKVFTESKKGKGCLNLFSSQPFEFKVTDKFYAPAVDWLSNGAKAGIKYINHWHGSTKTPKTKKNRFLGIIQVLHKDDKESFSQIKLIDKNSFNIDGWSITAELNLDKSPSLKVIDENELNGFNLGGGSLNLMGKEFKSKNENSSLLVEFNGEDFIVKEAIDVLPSSMLYR